MSEFFRAWSVSCVAIQPSDVMSARSPRNAACSRLGPEEGQAAAAPLLGRQADRRPVAEDVLRLARQGSDQSDRVVLTDQPLAAIDLCALDQIRDAAFRDAGGPGHFGDGKHVQLSELSVEVRMLCRPYRRYLLPMSQRLAVVTGASSGIGRAAAIRLAADGFRVLAVGRDERALAEVCSEIARHQSAAGPTGCETLSVDVTSDDAPRVIRDRVHAMSAGVEGLDALVNAAGIIASADIATTTDAAWDQMMTINVRAPFRLIREFVPALEVRKGSVVNLSSVAGTRVFPNVLAYCVSKAAVDQLTRAAAIDLAPKGVRVNAVNPGVVVTNLHRRSGMDDTRYAAFLEHSKTTHPLGRPGTPDEIAALIAYLVSPAAGWVTGETIAIDGGRHLTCLR